MAKLSDLAGDLSKIFQAKDQKVDRAPGNFEEFKIRTIKTEFKVINGKNSRKSSFDLKKVEH